jgi:MoaA/NifB/PqqE/SkfB family radical SAM enzyme
MGIKEAVKPIRRVVNRVLGYPDEVVVEPTNYCNLECPACASRRDQWDGERGYMDLASFQQMVEELEGKTLRMAFIGRGEPTLHPQIDAMVRFAHERGFKTIMLSNGTLLSVQERADRLAAAGLDRITIGLDGLTQESYEAVRKGGKVDDVFQALANITQAKRAGSQIALNVHVLLTKYNEGQLAEYAKLRDKYDIDGLTYSHIMVPGEIGLQCPERFEKLVAAYVLEEAQPYHRFGDKSPGKCGSSKRTSIRYDGDMQLCCRDTTSHRGLGNVFEEGFFTVWNRNRETRVRVRDKSFDVCTYCSKSVGYERQNKVQS